ncbi:MAG: glucose-6-phosphate isomerase [Chlamydiia bacterium]|nr:glucose-6-phosphate isomerase [Chlamydiia bacterium]
MFLESTAAKKLQALSQHPVDLTQELTPERIRSFQLEAQLQGLGFTLYYAMERVTTDVLAALFALAKEMRALEKMQAMQAGEVLNKIEGYPSENRAVLHTAMRDQFDAKQTAKPAQDAAQMAAKELAKLEVFLKQMEGRYTDIIQIGIGGSDLGPRALYIAMEAFRKPQCRAHFISNVDPDDANQVLASVDLKKTLVVVVSKSGSTLETLTNEAFVRSKMESLGLNPKEHFIAVTGEKSPMDNPSRYKASFYMWDFVGGRYSATSMVGAVMLGFSLGFEKLRAILHGAHDMDVHARSQEPAYNLPLLSALLGIWNRNFLRLPTLAIIPYSQALLRFPAHLQQLDMESNGKWIDKTGKACPFSTGPVIWGEPGTNGQHSFYQLIHQGTDPVPLEFIGFRKCQRGHDLVIEGSNSQQKLLANLFAQSIALAIGQQNENPNRFFPGNRPNRILLADQLTPYTLGALLSYYEHKVTFQGFIWNINSFDQEGVQLGKLLANKMLDLYKGTGASFPLGEAFL